ncbi:MAG: VWA domain-containing protein [Deltaproteobacteria bacterium]|nr:VWA domain-containing protein [Deltaproteobacteria bacterium]
MKRCLFIVLALVLIVSSRLGADDTSIYGTESISIAPNILIIFDTSGSMSTEDVPGEYYNPATYYSGDYTNNAVYQKVYGWLGGWSYDLFASNVNDLNCPDVKTALETYGYDLDTNIGDSGDGYTCTGSEKDLYMGNWINYDEAGYGILKSRTEVAKEVITSVINNTDNVRFGLMRFNDDQGGRIVQECGADKTTLISTINVFPASGWTPLAETLAEAGLYFAGKESWYNDTGTYSTPMQYRCQNNYIILMTDGEMVQTIWTM